MVTVNDEILSRQQVYERFDSEWILMGDPETDANLEVLSGHVLWHSKDRDEVYRKALELKPKRSAILFTGVIPDDAVVVL